MSAHVRRSIVVPEDAETLWSALTLPEQLRAWFGGEVELDPRAGGSVRATWPDGGRSVGSVEIADHPERLVFRWRRIEGAGFRSRVGVATRVSFELRRVAGGTEFRVTEEPVELASVVGS